MGVLDLFRPSVTLSSPVPEIGPAPVPSANFVVGSDLATWQALVNGVGTPRVSRIEAASVPAVKRARDLVCGTLGTLPLHATNALGQPVDHALLAQPEAPVGYVRAVTITRTVEDLLYDGRCLWLVLLRTAAGFPQAVERIDIGKWTQDQDTREIRVGGRVVDPRDCILFVSPNDALLTAGARAIRALLLLEQTAAMYAAEPEAATYFTSRDGGDPDEDDVLALLNAWVAARRKRATAYVPSAYTLNKTDRMTAEELQLIDARSFAVTEVARLTGIDAEELSVSTTSRTYSNQQDRRRAFIDFVLSPYMHAIEERLTLGDVTPRGQQVRFNLDAFLRASTAERYAAYAVALDKNILTVPEVRDLEDLPPLGEAST